MHKEINIFIYCLFYWLKEYENPMSPPMAPETPAPGLFHDNDMFSGSYDDTGSDIDPASVNTTYDAHFGSTVSFHVGSDVTMESPSMPNTRRRAAAAAAAGSATPGSKTPGRGKRGREQPVPAESPSPHVSPDEPVGKRPRGRAAGGSKRGAAAAATVDHSNIDEDDSLYNAVLQGKCSLQALVDDWIDDYKSNKDSTLLKLSQFFISASGCKGKITPQMASMEHAAIIR